MSVGKITFTSVEPYQPQKSYDNELSVQPSIPEDKKKSNAAKYMIGAATLAGVIALGIIGHKNNWWRKAAEGMEGLGRKAEEAIGTSRIDYSDFSKIEGELVEDGSKVVKNNKGKVINKTFKNEKDGNLVVYEYDPKTGNPLRFTKFADDGRTIRCIGECNLKTGNTVKYTVFADDGKTISDITKYDPKTGNPLRFTKFADDGKAITAIIEYDPETCKVVKRIIR